MKQILAIAIIIALHVTNSLRLRIRVVIIVCPSEDKYYLMLCCSWLHGRLAAQPELAVYP